MHRDNNTLGVKNQCQLMRLEPQLAADFDVTSYAAMQCVAVKAARPAVCGSNLRAEINPLPGNTASFGEYRGYAFVSQQMLLVPPNGETFFA